MKAKVKATGKVIEVEKIIEYSEVPGTPFGADFEYYKDEVNQKTYNEDELDFIHVYPDWQSVRIQAAIAAMQGFYARNDILNIARSDVKGMKEFISKLAVEQADSLIEELKKTM